jgi:microsomal epoxide hydrolase
MEFLRLIGPLTNPRAYGGDPEDAFHVVIPSPPGFGLSGPTRDAGWSVRRVAKAMAELMHRLGYERYVAHGGDFGAMVTPGTAMVDPEHVQSVHVTLLASASASGNYAVGYGSRSHRTRGAAQPEARSATTSISPATPRFRPRGRNSSALVE